MLKQIYKFTEDELEISFRYFRPEKISAKSYFLKEGNISDRLGFVQSGLLRSFVYNDEADDITTHFFQRGSVVISLYSFNNQVPSRENIIALENSDLLVITYNQMQELQQVVGVWRQIAKDTDEHKYNQQMKRAIHFQTLSASERYQLLMQKNPEVIQKVPLRHIASYLGMDIATLSRIRKKL